MNSIFSPLFLSRYFDYPLSVITLSYRIELCDCSLCKKCCCNTKYILWSSLTPNQYPTIRIKQKNYAMPCLALLVTIDKNNELSDDIIMLYQLFSNLVHCLCAFIQLLGAITFFRMVLSLKFRIVL